MSDPKINNYMKPQPFIGHRRMSVAQMMDFLGASNFRHLPILDNGKVIGVVHEAVLKEASGLDHADSLTAEDIMSTNPLIVVEGTPVKEVALQMAHLKQDCALIVDKSEELRGIFTTIDGMRMLAMVLRTSPDICKGLEAIENYTIPVNVGA